MAKWEDLTWSLKVSIEGSDVDLKPNSTNSFKFVKNPGPNQTIVSYTLEPDPGNSMREPWKHLKLVPQNGLVLTKTLGDVEDPLDPEDADLGDKIAALVQEIRVEKLNDLGHLFERLVGVMTIRGLDHSVTFYKVANVYTKPAKVLLICEIKSIPGNPNGVVGGNN